MFSIRSGIKRKFWFVLALCFYYSLTVFPQNADSVKLQKLQAMGFFQYPVLSELAKNIFDDSLIQSVPLISQDVNTNFSNNEDLLWLKDVASRNKVILLAEEHYHNYTSNIRNRILFYLNTINYYPLIVMEAQYSYTGYFNYYINLTDDADAKKYYSDVIYSMVTDVETYDLLNHIRKWNKLNPSKKITIGFSDIEHDYRTTIKNVLLPYFNKINGKLKIDTKDFSIKDLGDLLPKFYSLLTIVKKNNLMGELPFLNPDYISNVINNLEATYKAYYYEFNFYRQKAIVRNLTDPKFFGNYFKNFKVLLYGGNYHMTTHFSYPDNANFYREGSYLSEDFMPTKGKVYSISVHCFSRSLGKMAKVNIDSCLQQGSYYISLIKRWQGAFNAKLINENDYLLEFGMNDLHKLIMRKAIALDNQPILINKIDWVSILKLAKNYNGSLYNDLKNWSEDYSRYDIHIFIPRSPFITAMEKQRDKIDSFHN